MVYVIKVKKVKMLFCHRVGKLSVRISIVRSEKIETLAFYYFIRNPEKLLFCNRARRGTKDA